MTGTDVVPSELSPKMQRAATLEAAGIARAEIAQAVGVSTKTLVAWNKRDDFQLAVTAAAGSQLARLENSVALLQQSAIDAANRALDKLLEALEAQDEYDRPHWKIQVEAAKELISNPAVRALVDPKGTAASGPQAVAAVTLVKIVREGDSETVEFIEHDGEAKEVGDVEPGQTAED